MARYGLETIEREISELEVREASYRLCERLADLYVCRDHLIEKMQPQDDRVAIEGSEFLNAVNGKPYADVLKVVDEHLETIRMLYPKTYDSVIERIRQLG